MLDHAYVVYLYILIWIFITLLISYSTVTVTCLTREASYKGAGLWKQVNGNFGIFSTPRLPIHQQQGVVA